MLELGCCRHEGEGSVFALLKAKGWATQLSTGEAGSSFTAKSFFNVTVVLTKEGTSFTISTLRIPPACASLCQLNIQQAESILQLLTIERVLLSLDLMMTVNSCCDLCKIMS